MDPLAAEEVITFAQTQLRDARKDPRTSRPRGAMLDDFFAHFDEADRTRALHIWSVHEMRHAVTHERARLSPDLSAAPATGETAASLQAAAERAELAEADIANEHPLMHAMILIGMHGALDALVEELTPAAQAATVDLHATTVVSQVRDQHLDLTASLPAGALSALTAALREELAEHLPKTPRLQGSGSQRWEHVLRSAGLHAPAGRPIPHDLDQALREMTNIRDVLVHRAGRLDAKAIRACPTLVTTLSITEGHLIRLTSTHYRRYSAAMRAYGLEIQRRVLTRGGIDQPLNLDYWEDYYALGS